jgi:hypothetical protein
LVMQGLAQVGCSQRKSLERSAVDSAQLL